jgi:DNA invertase Pin-like site-specific DNA recombinase
MTKTSTDPNPNQLPQAVLYLRSASTKQADRDMAIVAQQHNCLRRADELGARVVAEYIDLGSGLRAERPGLIALLAKLGEIQAESDQSPTYVIAYDHARIARDPQTYIRVVWAIEQTGATLIIASRPLVEYEAIAGRTSEVYPDFPARTFAQNPGRTAKQQPLTNKED